LSLFTNIRVVPTHGFRAATISWELPASEADGEVYVAFSATGVEGSWEVRNPDAPVAAATGFYADQNLVINSGAEVGYYQLLLTRNGVDTFSEKIGIFHDLDRREYGIIHRIVQREFLEMRAASGFPVYHCIPRTTGILSPRVDPDTGKILGNECPDVDPAAASFNLPFVGGFYPPVLTWMRAISIRKDTIDDGANNNSSTQVDVTKVKLLPWPKPLRDHMFVDPATDRRWLVKGEVLPLMYRGIYPVGFEAELYFLPQSDPRYRFVVPPVDLRAYRKLKYWS
jgi:hypothetical protein